MRQRVIYSEAESSRICFIAMGHTFSCFFTMFYFHDWKGCGQSLSLAIKNCSQFFFICGEEHLADLPLEPSRKKTVFVYFLFFHKITFFTLCKSTCCRVHFSKETRNLFDLVSYEVSLPIFLRSIIIVFSCMFM